MANLRPHQKLFQPVEYKNLDHQNSIEIIKPTVLLGKIQRSRQDTKLYRATYQDGIGFFFF